MASFKIIKETSFTTSKEESGIHYSVAYKGRVFGVNTLRFENDEDIKADKGLLSFNCPVEIVKDKEGYLTILPKIDLALAEF